MSSIVTAVFKATIGLLVNKGRNTVADRLKEGDIADQRFRCLIIREIDENKSKLDGLARTNLLASISFFKEGLVYLYKGLESAKTIEENGKRPVQGKTETEIVHAVEEGNLDVSLRSSSASLKTVSLAKEVKSLQLTDQDDLSSSSLFDAKDRFKQAREKSNRSLL